MARRGRFLANAVVVAVVAATAFDGMAPLGADAPSRASQGSPEGVIRIAAAEEPGCVDWIGSCAGVVWGNWVLGNLTLPQALVVDPEGAYVPGDLLVDEPTLEPGPPMRVTYRIRPEAVWSDGEPITSEDFAYTWREITRGRGIYDTTGYDQISAIDTSDPKVAIVTFEDPFAAWRDLFGGLYYVLPSHILDGTSRHKAMKDGYAFSGGPWRLDRGRKGWKKGRSMTLVPNEGYWGTKPQIGRVIFQFIPDSAAELEALTTGQVVAAYPLPQDGALDQLDDKPNLSYTVSFGNSFEAIFINAAKEPFTSQAVRQAVAYATDRQTIVEQILRPSIRQGRVLQSFIVPTFRQFFVAAFEQYGRDLGIVNELMTADGWRKNPNGIWAKDGKRAGFQVVSTSGDEARSLTMQLWQSQLLEAGFDVQIKSLSPDVLFTRRVPQGKYQAGVFASVGTPDPGLCIIFCSKNIPTKKNAFQGLNFTRTDSPAIDTPWLTVDRTLDDVTRLDAVRQGQIALAEYVASIPLYQSPTIFVYDSERIGGNVVDNSVLGPFFTMNEWTLS